MSSILKALQKLEQERAARRGGPPDISEEILKQGKTAKSAPRWLLPVGMAVVAAVAVLATYTLMGGFSTRKISTNSTSTSVAAQHTTPASPPPSEVVPSGGTGGTAATAPSLPPVEVIRNLPVVHETATRKASVTPKPARQQAAPAPGPRQPAATPVKADTPPPAPAKPSRPSLTVGGIAWQQNNSLRLAVVNGMSVTEGSVVEGARVEEIYPDRIRFSFRNERFELPLEK